MTGYVRKDTTNNIADGNVINAADLDSEFDGVQAAFNASTGHKHDGTAAEGATINSVGPTQDVTISATLVAPKTTNTIDIGSSALKFKDLFLAGNSSIGGTLAVTGVATLTAQPILSSLTASSAVATDASKGLVSVTNTGTGNNVLATSPTLVTPILGIPQSATLTNATGLPLTTGVTGTLPVANGGTGLTAGTSGGVLAYTAAGTLASSSALAASALVIGGGAGAAPSTTTTGTGVVTALGVNTGSAGAFVVNGGALGTPSSGTVTNLTGTASININGTVGATTATTGAFTTVTTGAADNTGLTLRTYTGGSYAAIYSRSVTPGLTNYVLATDGAVTALNGSTTTRLEVGGTTVATVTSTGLAVTGALSASSTATAASFIPSGSTVPTNGVYLPAANTLGFATNSGEAMRLTSTGLGIGTSSPDTLLTLVPATNTAYSLHFGTNDYGTSYGTKIYVQSKNPAGTTSSLHNTTKLTSSVNGRADVDQYLSYVSATAANDYQSWSTAGTSRMLLDSTGLAVTGTLSATKATAGDSFSWTNGGATPKTGYLYSDSQSVGMFTGANASGTALGVYMDITNAKVYTAIGTSGNITTVSSTGLAVTGTLSASGVVTAKSTTAASWATLGAFQVDSAAFSGYLRAPNITGNAYYNGGWKYIGTGEATNYAQGDAAERTHQWSSAVSGTAGNAISWVEQMRLNSSGNLGLGVTPSAWSTSFKGFEIAANGNGFMSANNSNSIYLVQNTYYDGAWKANAALPVTNYAQANGVHSWYTNPSPGANTAFTPNQVMTLDASGNLLVGTTSASNTPVQGVNLMQNGGVGVLSIGHINGTGSGNAYEQYCYNGTAIGSITQSGTTAVLYNLTSDLRLKENIQDAESSSSLIDAIQVRQFNWKSDGSHTRYGFIAQELVTVAPEAVHQPVDPEEMMAVDYSKLVPMLVKEIQDLRKRLADAGI